MFLNKSPFDGPANRLNANAKNETLIIGCHYNYPYHNRWFSYLGISIKSPEY